MINFSRRQLAKYAVEELLIGKKPVAEIAKHLAAALAAEGKSKQVELLLADIDSELEQRGLLAKAKISSAHPLPAKLKKELESSIKKAAGVERLIVEHSTDPDLIGGIRVETSTRSWDRSLKRVLRAVRETN